MSVFASKALKIASQKNSRLVLAVDIYAERREHRFKVADKLGKLLSSVEEYVAGVKIGLPTILSLTPDVVKELITNRVWNFFFIADMKLADIGYVSSFLVKEAAFMGFNAIIAHAVIGYNAVKAIVSEAKIKGLGVLTVCAMTHEGADEAINKLFSENVNASLKAGVDGLILPATRPQLIKEARRLVKDKIIMSPGVGVQGARPGAAISAGADFEIIGRSIYLAKDPRKAAEFFAKKLRW